MYITVISSFRHQQRGIIIGSDIDGTGRREEGNARNNHKQYYACNKINILIKNNFINKNFKKLNKYRVQTNVHFE